MPSNHRLWGAERIRGEVLKLDIRVCKRTIQKYMKHGRLPRPSGQRWATMLHNHAADMWACDFLQVADLLFRLLFAFFIIELKSRKVIHIGVIRFPTGAWAAQQLREATLYGQTPMLITGVKSSLVPEKNSPAGEHGISWCSDFERKHGT